jgi:hypothetical protein
VQHVALNSESLRKTLTAWLSGSDEHTILALMPEAEKEKLPILQGLCRELDVPMFGAIFPALIVQGAFTNDGVLLIHFTHRIRAAVLPEIDTRGSVDAERINHLVLGMLDANSPRTDAPTLFLIFDGMLPNIESLLESLYGRLADRVRYAGVNAGSETFQPVPCVFNENETVNRGLLAVLLPDHSTTVLAHGYRQPKRMLSATATAGNRIAMIDWQPAFAVYQRLIKDQYNIELTRENFYAYGVHFPFGILRANSDLIVRTPVILEEDGSLVCAGEVPENSILVLLQAPAADENGCIRSLAQTLENENGSLQGRRLMTFYCAGRRKHLGNGAQVELDILQQTAGVSEIFGAVSQGEIGSTQIDGYPMFHNAALVCTPWDAE